MTAPEIEKSIAACKAEVDKKVDKNTARIEELHTCISRISEKVDNLHEDHSALRSDIGELLSIFRAGKGAIKVFGWFGVAAKWFLAIAAAIAAVVAYIKGGFNP